MTGSPQEQTGGGQADVLPGIGLNEARLSKVLERMGGHTFLLAHYEHYPSVSEEYATNQKHAFIHSIDAAVEGLGVVKPDTDWPDLFIEGYVTSSYGHTDQIHYDALMRSVQAGRSIGEVFFRLGWDTLPLEMCEDGDNNVHMDFLAARGRVLSIDLRGNFDEVRSEPDYEWIGYRVSLAVTGAIMTMEKYEATKATVDNDADNVDYNGNDTIE